MEVVSVKKILVNIVFSGLLFGLSFTGSAQCVPDTANCKGNEGSGQICPDSIPNGMQGVEYHQVITFIMPDSVSVGDMELKMIRLDTVENLPAGIRFISADNEFYPDSVYCFELTGTPEDTGTFYIKIILTPFVDLLGNTIALPPQTDSTNIIMQVEESTTGIVNIINENVTLIPGYPNPFRFSTRIGFYSQEPGTVKLMIFNMIGKVVYRENLHTSGGKEYFKFRGDALPSGIYIYTVTKNQTTINAKLVKTK